jgi:SAM-dependent methyltransferase
VVQLAGVRPGDRVLEVAAGLPVSGAPVTWRQSIAEQLPFPADSFDVVCCQLGLRFFADRPAALREMARVLARRGRLVAMVWRPIEYSPGFAALAKALDRHVGAAAGALMRAPFALGEEDELRALVQTAGFTQTHIRRTTGAARSASAPDLVLAYGTWITTRGASRRSRRRHPRGAGRVGGIRARLR